MPAEKRELIDYARTQHKCSLRQACLLFSLSTSVYYYKAKRNPQVSLEHVKKNILSTKYNDVPQCTHRITSQVRSRLDAYL